MCIQIQLAAVPSVDSAKALRGNEGRAVNLGPQSGVPWWVQSSCCSIDCRRFGVRRCS